MLNNKCRSRDLGIDMMYVFIKMPEYDFEVIEYWHKILEKLCDPEQQLSDVSLSLALQLN